MGGDVAAAALRVLRPRAPRSALDRRAAPASRPARTRSSTRGVARGERGSPRPGPASPTDPGRRTRPARGCRAAASASSRGRVDLDRRRRRARAERRGARRPRRTVRLPTRIRRSSRETRPARATRSRRSVAAPARGCGWTGHALQLQTERVAVDQREHPQRGERVARGDPRRRCARQLAAAQAERGVEHAAAPARLSMWTDSVAPAGAARAR